MSEKTPKTKIVPQISVCQSSGSFSIKMCPNLYSNLKAIWFKLKKKKPRNLNPKVSCTGDGNIPQLESRALSELSLIYVSLNEAQLQALAKFYMSNFFYPLVESFLRKLNPLLVPLS